MRLRELVQPYLERVRTVVDYHSGTLDIGPELQLPAGTSYERRAPVGALTNGRDELAIGVLGPDAVRHGDDASAAALLEAARRGSHAVLLLGYPPLEAPLGRILDDVTRAGCQLLQLSTLDHDELPSAAVFARLDRLLLPRDPFGEPIDPGEDDADQALIALRLANAFVLSDFSARQLRRQLVLTSDQREEHAREIQRQRAELEVLVGEAEERIERAQAELARIEESTSYRLGRALVQVALAPRRASRLPRDLGRIWRRRGVAARSGGGARTQKQPVAPPMTQPAAAGESDERRRFLSHSDVAIGPRRRPLVAGILRHETAAALSFDATVDEMTPNDAMLVLERSDPDLVLVETGAFAPSRPWAFAGNAAGVERDRGLAALLDRAHALGRATVLVRDAWAHDAVGLVALESKFDLVLDAAPQAAHPAPWSRGVQLALFHAVGALRQRPGPPLFVGGWDARASRTRQRAFAEALASAAQEGLEIQLDAFAEEIDAHLPASLRDSVRGRVHWRDTASLYRRTPAALADPFSTGGSSSSIEPRTLELLAAGVRVVSAPDPTLAASLGDFVAFAQMPSATRQLVREAREAGGRMGAALRAVLRPLFEQHASIVMLAQLFGRLGLAGDPLAARSVALLVRLEPDTNRGALVDGILRQRHRPVEVVVALHDESDAGGSAFEALDSEGISVRVTRDSGTPRWPDLARDATAEWLTLWPSDTTPPDVYLLDLLIGAEVSRADAVGYGKQAEASFVTTLDAAAAMVRRVEALRGGALGTGPMEPSGSRWIGAAVDRVRPFCIGEPSR